ncbi:hypothetical protein ASE40_19235 [Flavobacterium sp. Root935]|nr:hypothetical protein ASE40_19235 [Flavobacterium sp. Root935]
MKNPTRCFFVCREFHKLARIILPQIKGFSQINLLDLLNLREKFTLTDLADYIDKKNHFNL